MEYFGVKLCIGGHKHTYACTYPVRENYFYTTSDGTTKNSIDGIMTMEETLANDTATWLYPADYSDETLQGYNTSKKPYVKGPAVDNTVDVGYMSPMIEKDDLTNGVVYFMCQATGYKLTSNKELPSNYQHFAKLIPKTGNKNGSDTADGAQQYPMFAIINMSGNNYNIKLARIECIKESSSHNFTQSEYDTGTPYLKYAQPVADSRYCD